MTFAQYSSERAKRQLIAGSMTLKFLNNLSIVENPKFVRFIRAFLLLVLSWPAYGDWREDVEQQLFKQWRQLTGDSAEAQISFIGISDDYQLPRCQSQPEMRLTRALQAGKNGLQLSCGSPYWNQHIAIQLHVMQPVVVLTRPLRNKELATNSHLRVSKLDIGELNKGFFNRIEEVSGLQAKRSLPPGTVLSPDMLEQPILIKRGEKVAIRLSRPGIQVEMDGQAMAQGRAGQRIRVRNLQSKKIISAVVIARGLVQVQ